MSSLTRQRGEMGAGTALGSAKNVQWPHVAQLGGEAQTGDNVAGPG